MVKFNPTNLLYKRSLLGLAEKIIGFKPETECVKTMVRSSEWLIFMYNWLI